MVNIFKYLKDSILTVLLIIVLLIIQANCDLSLPQYTSDIIDIGITKSGISEVIPEVIRESEYEKLQLFLNEDGIKKLEAAYEKIDLSDLSDKEAENLKDKYPALKTETLYQMTLEDKDDIKQTEKVLKKPVMMMAILSTDNSQTKEIKNGILSSLTSQGSSQDTTTTTVAEQPDIFTILSAMTVDQRIAMMDGIVDKFGNMKDTMIGQMASIYNKAEYKAIGIDMGNYQTNYIIKVGAKMLGVSLLAMVMAVLVGLLASRVAAKTGMNLRNKVFRNVVSFSNVEMDHFSTASLITRSTNDIQQIQMVTVLILRMVLYAPILGIGGILKVLKTDVSMGWIILLAVGVIVMVVLVLLVVAMPKFRLMQTLVDKVNLVAREILTGLPVIRAFSTQSHEEKRFDQSNIELTKTQLFTSRTMSFMFPVMILIMNCVSIMIVWFGGKAIDAGTLQVGDMVAFLTYAMQIIMSFLMITMVSIMLPRAGVAANRINEVITTKFTINDPEVSKTISGKGVVSFQNVSFRYPNAEQEVLSNITFEAKNGETTAIIGSTGCGKSTLVNLIPRFYDVTEGRVLIDGVDVRELSQRDLRDKLGYVPQKGVLFSGTIASNIKFGGKDISDETMDMAARVAQAQEFISEKPEKFDSEIAQGGTNVSGGQKQRLSIARAIAKKPMIYIFDDSFSALDYKTDVTLRRALREETADSAVIIVAQRISTILHADQIIVLDDGKIVGKGKHAELLKDCDVYKQIAVSQLSEEEIESSVGGKEAQHE